MTSVPGSIQSVTPGDGSDETPGRGGAAAVGHPHALGSSGGRPQDTPAWALAFLPLATALAGIAAQAMGLHPGVLAMASLSVSVALIVMDKREIARTGLVAPKALPSTAWAFFPPGYLRRRARAVGEPSGRFWLSLGCMALAFVAQAAVFASRTADLADIVAQAPALPACTEDANMQDVIDTFSDVKPMRDAGVRGVVLTDRAEIPGGERQIPPLRFCSGTMQASNGEDYAVRYGYEIVEGRVIVHVQLQ